MDRIELTSEEANLAYQLARENLQRATRNLEAERALGDAAELFLARIALTDAAGLVSALESSPEVEDR